MTEAHTTIALDTAIKTARSERAAAFRAMLRSVLGLKDLLHIAPSGRTA